MKNIIFKTFVFLLGNMCACALERMETQVTSESAEVYSDLIPADIKLFEKVRDHPEQLRDRDLMSLNPTLCKVANRRSLDVGRTMEITHNPADGKGANYWLRVYGYNPPYELSDGGGSGEIIAVFKGIGLGRKDKALSVAYQYALGGFYGSISHRALMLANARFEDRNLFEDEDSNLNFEDFERKSICVGVSCIWNSDNEALVITLIFHEPPVVEEGEIGHPKATGKQAFRIVRENDETFIEYVITQPALGAVYIIRDSNDLEALKDEWRIRMIRPLAVNQYEDFVIDRRHISDAPVWYLGEGMEFDSKKFR